MNKHLLKLIFRRLGSKPLYPVISILGLTIGFLATIIVAHWAYDEFSYDDHLSDADNIYRLTVKIDNDEINWHWDFARSHYGWLMDMPNEIPGIEGIVRINRLSSGIVKYEETAIAEQIFTADQSVVDFFSLQFISGDPVNCLTGPEKVIMSESMAKKIFGVDDPIDKTLFLYCSSCTEKIPYRVTAIFKDIPHNSHVHFNIIRSIEKPEERMGWAYYYLKHDENTDPDDILASFDDFASKYVNENSAEILTPKLQKIKNIHLQSAKDRELEKNGSLAQVKMILGLAGFVLLISLFNFFNLSYINLLKDLKSIKILNFAGARKRGAITFLFSQSMLYSTAAAILTFLTVLITFPLLNKYFGKVPEAGEENIIQILLISLPVLILHSSAVGIAPYWIQRSSGYIRKMLISSNQLSGTIITGARSGILKFLVGLQYFFGLILILSVLVINGQIQLFMDNTLGEKTEQILCIKDIPVQVINKYRVLKEELLKNPLIYNVTSSMQEPGDEIRDMAGFITSGSDVSNKDKNLYLNPVDDNYFDFYDIPIVAGSNFPKFSGNDSAPENYILNEKAVEYLGWDVSEAIGRPFRIRQQYASKEMGRIVGIVQDFHPATMKEEVHPTVFLQKSFWLYSGHIRFDTSNTAASIAAIQKVWNDVYPDFPMEYEFVDNLYQEVYAGEFQLRKISLLLCILALIISSSGLFGITGITYEVRTKEIGIRKVNGATIPGILKWLISDVITILALSIFVAIPSGWFLMHRWLNNYTIRTDIKLWMFLFTILIVFVIAILTVGWQSWRAATRNPVEALRYE